jgi:hypothetical protein
MKDAAMGRCPPTGSSTIRGALSATSHCPQRRANIVAAASIGEQPVRQAPEDKKRREE